MPTPESQSAHEEIVYLLGTPGSNTVKIGRTTNLRKRLADIQRMSPVPLAALWTHPGGSELETNLHRHFAPLRSHGEWFAFDTDPVQAVNEAVSRRPWLSPKAAPRPQSLHVAPLDPVVVATLAEIREIEDPIGRFGAAKATRSLIGSFDGRFAQIERDVILELRTRKFSWRKIGELLGTSGANAERIAKRRRS